MDTALDIVGFLKPKPCPVPLLRIGGDRDGAYLVPDDLEGLGACYSPGVLNRKDFEDDLHERYGIAAHMCDYSSDVEKLETPLRGGQTFRKRWLGVHPDAETITLEQWIGEETPDPSDLILQMDIEGAEYDTVAAAPDAVLRRFRIIVIEVHKLGKLNRTGQLPAILPFFRKLAANHVSVHLHPNNAGPQIRVGTSDYWLPKVLEVTLLRRDRFENASRLIPPTMPHPLDIAYNVPWKQPQAMGRVWTD